MVWFSPGAPGTVEPEFLVLRVQTYPTQREEQLNKILVQGGTTK